MPNSVYAIVLCEGLQDWVFFRRALVALGVPARDIRQVMSPGGEGSGEQFVRERYAAEVIAQRLRMSRRKAILLVHTDADRLSVPARAQTLADALAASGEPPRRTDERIAHEIPKRNIETWIAYLTDGRTVDEDTEYAKLTGRESECWPAAEAFAAIVRATPVSSLASAGPGAPPSLDIGVEEARRLL